MINGSMRCEKFLVDTKKMLYGCLDFQKLLKSNFYKLLDESEPVSMFCFRSITFWTREEKKEEMKDLRCRSLCCWRLIAE